MIEPVSAGRPNGSGATSSGPTRSPRIVSCGREPKFDCTHAPSTWPSTRRDAVPLPPFRPKLCMPAPPPTLPSGTGAGVRPAAAAARSAACEASAASIASVPCAGRTCRPRMSFEKPS